MSRSALVVVLVLAACNKSSREEGATPSSTVDHVFADGGTAL